MTNDPLIPTPTDDQKRVGGHTRPRAKALGVLIGSSNSGGDAAYTPIGTGSEYERVGREIATGKRPDRAKASPAYRTLVARARLVSLAASADGSADMVDYTPTLPEGMELPKGSSINTEHPDYKALMAVAREEGLSQKAFSRVLGVEVARHGRARAVAPAPSPSPAPAAKPDFSRMSFAEKANYSLNNPKRG